MTQRREEKGRYRGRTRGSAKGAGRYRWKLAFLAAVCLCLVVYLLQGEDDTIASVMLGNDTQDLLSALRLAREKTSVNSIHTVTDCMMRVGLTLDGMLATADDKSTATATQKIMTHTVETYRLATAFVLEILSSLFQEKPRDVVLQNHRAEPKFLWRWIAVAAYALTTVLPEYFLALDDTETHGEVLVMGLHVLLHASNAASSSSFSPLLPTERAALVDCIHYEKNPRWEKFCSSGFSNLHGLEVRRAAILEELIALHPEYAPLRLHYVVALSLGRHAAKTEVVFGLIDRERARLHTRTHVDPLHGAFLGLCKAFVSSVEKTRRVEAIEGVVEGLRQINTCARLLRPFHEDMGNWRRYFRGQERPDVMDKRQARRLLDAMRELLQEKGISESLPPGLRACGEGD
ncbi:hypothetical protein TCDM_02197 [Trypanosoma cruzi Dm28c]|uniref:Uncharacterized protein n=2 Tax=Trypanosoma cruzi TaxID=5693 RepID=V5B6R4_TRYCR|nr:hypothetical protein TCDM_02197 [Trypanosoma cruzi Dm28c]PWU92059.1 hypothetical protein C4B63_40g115 [Trypanosoma cruzi]